MAVDPKPKRESRPLRIDDEIFRSRPTNCRSCGAEIWFARMPSGRFMPVNADKTSHFATCPQAKDWRKKS